MSTRSVTGQVFATEMRGLLRDRRALFMAVVLPMLLFPLMFYGMDQLGTRSEESLAERELRVGHALGPLDEPLRATIYGALGAEELHLALEPLQPTGSTGSTGSTGDASPAALGAPPDRASDELQWNRWRTRAMARLGEEFHALLLARAGESPGDRPALWVVADGSDNLGKEARSRLRRTLGELRDRGRLSALLAQLELDPGAPLELTRDDVAAAEDTLGKELGGLLPLVLVLILLSSGSFAALGAFAAEREEGTLETLLVQPVPSSAVATGKFLAVLVTGWVAGLGNALGFLACLGLGLGGGEALAEDLPLATGLVRLGLGLALFLPTSVFLSALLCLVSVRARSFRQGQHYVFPLMLIGALLASAASQDRLPLNPLLAAVPVTGSTLVLRDALLGTFEPLSLVSASLSSLAFALLALRQVARALDDEGLFAAGGDNESAARRIQSRRALAFGWSAVALVYLVGGRLQTAWPVLGLVLTLWVLVPALALAAARGTARRTGDSLLHTLGLGRPVLAHLAGALLLAPALVLIVRALLEWQNGFLPLPSSLADSDALREFEALSPLAIACLFGLSPGLWEEVLYRGAILSGLRRDLSPARVVLWQMVLFGAVHASVHRFLPTALLGGVLALVAMPPRGEVRGPNARASGRLWPAVLLHSTYNTLVALEATSHAAWSTPLALGLAPVGLLLLWRPRRPM